MTTSGFILYALIIIRLKGIWQYKLSLSYLKEHLKLYINVLSLQIIPYLAWFSK